MIKYKLNIKLFKMNVNNFIMNIKKYRKTIIFNIFYQIKIIIIKLIYHKKIEKNNLINLNYFTKIFNNI